VPGPSYSPADLFPERFRLSRPMGPLKRPHGKDDVEAMTAPAVKLSPKVNPRHLHNGRDRSGQIASRHGTRPRVSVTRRRNWPKQVQNPGAQYRAGQILSGVRGCV